MFLEEPASRELTASEFYDRMMSAATLLQNRVGDLHSFLRRADGMLLTEPFSQVFLNSLSDDYWKMNLTATDASRLDRICFVLRRSQDYFASTDFENRADCLRGMLLSLQELLQTIQSEPTDVSYDVFLPVLEHI